jgi:PAS domain S-box-containing protein
MTITSRWKRQSAFLPRSLHRLVTGVPLSWALTVPFVLLTVGSTTLVGYLSHRSGEQIVTNLANQLMQEKGNQTVLYLERSLEMPHLINQLNADSLRLGQLPGFETTNPEPLEKFFREQLRRFPDVTTIAMASDRGGMVGSGRRLPIGSGNLNVYRTSQFARGKYTISSTNAAGKITATQTISENYDARTRPWYQAPAKAGKATWSPIYQYFGDVPVLGISAGLPVYTDSGKLRGILTADIDLKSLSHFLANLNLSPSGQVFIVERSGLLVANSTNQSIVEMQAGEAERVRAGESEDPTVREMMAQLNARSQDLSHINGTQQFTIEQSSAKWVRVIPFQDQYGLDWLIVMVVPESDFMQVIHANQATTLWLCLLTLGGAIWLGIFATNRLTRYFSQLNRASQELAAGNLDRRLLTNGSISELNGLAHTFNRMADQIQDSFDRIKTALAESKEKFTTIFRTSPEGVAIASMTEGRFLEVNDSFLQFFGYSQDEVVGKTALELKIWNNPVQLDQYRALLEQEGSVRNLEAQVCTRLGEIKTVLLSAEVRTLEGQDCILVMHRDITDRKAVELALRQSEATLRRAQQVAHVGSWQVAVQTGKVTWTEESFHIMGWDIAQPEPSLPQFYELIHPDDQNLLRQRVKAAIIHQIPYRVEFRVMQPDGSLRYVEARGEAVVNEAGQTTHVIGTNLDITERVQAEEALRNSEATKNQILKAIPDLILWMTAEGNCIDLIEGNSITNLYNKSEAVGKSLYEILPFDLAQTRVNAIQNALETGEVQIYEQQVVLQSDIFYEEVRVIGVGDDRVLVIVRDVTDRKRAETALLDSEIRFRSAFSDAPIGMALIGLDDRWLKVNPMLCDMLGFSELELLPKTASSLVHPEDLNKLQQCIQQVLSSENRNAQVELRYCCQQGQIVWGSMSLSLVRDGQGKSLYYVAQIQDITERQAIDRMKNEFVSIVSHELRTPLTAIRGFLGLLDTGIYDKKPEKAKHMIGQALANSDRLVRLVNDILDLERLSSGKIQLMEEACSAEELMQRAVSGVQTLADQAKIQIVIVPTAAKAWADADCIIQTLTNLLSNAIKFSPPHSAITLSAQARTDTVLFAVQDQGRGIPADKLEAIFGRFQQVDVSDSRQKGGTGLGLAICRSIVQQHGGSIWAESIFGNGSTFYFTLPLMLEGER